ncbi:GIY-YIG nuclease family protein [Thioclava sp. JE_KL1]|uniref:GIY-YIG nuclease family protein n=1 Tax=Thioclava sp. JE_KL1 TaxID=2651187 RepID=UPI00128AF21D|nr:GIY-YIG nuclease family protein [Thioclava sp. JE_KL1]MPQ95332.1 GIY-YIG nuclease family protein [Thioclava sp. JE_KL1]
MNKPVHINRNEVLRQMRPLQKIAGELFIRDAREGNLPLTVSEAKQRYRSELGEGFNFDTGEDWADDIRDASIFCLIKYGFHKAKAVKLSSNFEDLSEWSSEVNLIEFGARLEYEFESNLRQCQIFEEMVATCSVHGTGGEAVYTYSDSLLDSLGHPCTKIGRHLSSSIGSVAARVVAQYGTGSPGKPVLRDIFRTDDAVKLETDLHRAFRGQKISGSFGTEWFEVEHSAVLTRYSTIVGTE